MSSQTFAAEQYEVQESLRVWVGDGDILTNESSQDGPLLQIKDRVTLSSFSRKEQILQCEKGGLDCENTRNELIRLLLERLTGRKIKLLSLTQFEPVRSHDELLKNGQSADDPEGFGLAYERYVSHSETQTLRFTSSGVILTEEGREIRFELQLEMESSFSSREYTEIRLGDARKVDPLVFSLNGESAMLTDATFSFDIDSDGVEEQIASLGPGRGFLALDKNGDGRITDGSELFGPSLGDGFLELAGLDEDGNGWIDDLDPKFKELEFWNKDALGNEVLLSMKEAGIGSFYAGRITSPFSLKNAHNELLGEVRESGIYLKENGSAGALQELDLVI